MSNQSTYWFPAKRYGWGWGTPRTWQGWVTLAVYAALIVAGIVLFPPERNVAAFLLHGSAASAALVLVCWLKGEPPRWRWGDEPKS